MAKFYSAKYHKKRMRIKNFSKKYVVFAARTHMTPEFNFREIVSYTGII